MDLATDQTRQKTELDIKGRLARINFGDFQGLFEKNYKVSAEHTTGATILDCMAEVFDQTCQDPHGKVLNTS